MDQAFADRFVRDYFHALFVERDVDSLDTYLDKNYWDDDIGPNETDHVANAKKYLRTMFKERPGAGVDVMRVLTLDDTITSYLYWYAVDGGVKTIMMKGVAIFEMKENRIARRHTHIYWRK